MKTIGSTIYQAFVVVVLGFLGLLPQVQAIVPAPDGGYPGGNTAEGDDALFNLTTGINNTAVGFNTLRNNTTGGWNVAIGASALASNTAGYQNMAIGTEALTNNNANFNSAVGFRALFMNTTGNHLTGIGAAALRNNTTGDFNTAIGADALHDNTTGGANTASGSGALYNNTTGNFNTAIGVGSLSENTTGVYNTANGYQALQSNTTGYLNAAIGTGALFSNTIGKYNTAIGTDALHYNTRGSNNIGLGNDTGIRVTTASNVICIGNILPGANVSNTCFIDNIWQQTGGSQAVYVNSDGKLGAQASSRRFKHDIKSMERSSEVIYQLNPVSFRYNPEIESAGPPGFGLIAEEVAEVNPALVLSDKEGKPYNVRYDAVNAMLLNEFLKEHKQVKAQETTIAKLKSTVTQQQKAFESKLAKQQAQIEALTAGLRKVSAQLELSKPEPQTVLNNH
jgi:trimeric autotransporter adhesin